MGRPKKNPDDLKDQQVKVLYSKEALESLKQMHQFRHSLQTHLRGQGVPDDLLRGVFGWSDSKVQDNYTHRELYDLAAIENALG